MNLQSSFLFVQNFNLFNLSSTLSNQVFNTLIIIMLATILVCFIVGELTRNFSQVDKIWSLIPLVYSWVVLSSFPNSPRILLMTLLVTIWGLRLTYNFSRKGGYNIIPWKGEEDYRWNILRQSPLLKKPLMTSLFNLLFIAIFQNILILLFTSPIIIAAENSNVDLNYVDFLAAGFMFLFIIIETISDNQLFKFHLQKQNKMAWDGKYQNSLSKGFMVDGFWKFVRHPNFAAEQAIWISFYFFSVAASGEWFNWSILGMILLVLLFEGSSRFTETISSGKYAEYENYKQKVPKFIPLFFKSK